MTDDTERPELPQAVARYFAAHDAHDVGAALAQFGPGAVVQDEGRAHVGSDDIRAWLSKAGRQYTYTRTPLGAEREADGAWTVRYRLDGNFPGGAVDLAYRFAFEEDLIARLVIAP